MRRILLSLAVAAFTVIQLAPRAHAMGLDVLAGGGSLTSGNGVLTFDDFDVITTGSVRSNLALYDVQALVDGIAITGPIAAAGGNIGDLFIQFTVSSTAQITGAKLRFNGAAVGAGASASVTESFDEIEDAQLFVFAGGGAADRSDSVTFEEGVTSLRVSKDILVDSGRFRGPIVSGLSNGDDGDKHWKHGKHRRHHHGGGGRPGGLRGGIAVISRIEQHFTTAQAPEPAALLLLGSALAGLAFARKRLA